MKWAFNPAVVHLPIGTIAYNLQVGHFIAYPMSVVPGFFPLLSRWMNELTREKSEMDKQ